MYPETICHITLEITIPRNVVNLLRHKTFLEPRYLALRLLNHICCEEIPAPNSVGAIPEGGENRMRKPFVALMALVIAMTFGTVTFVQAQEKAAESAPAAPATPAAAPAAAPEEKKDMGEHKGMEKKAEKKAKKKAKKKD